MWKIPSFFPTRNVFISVSFSVASERNLQVTSAENPQIKINSLKKKKRWYLIHTWSDIAFKGITGNQTLPSLLERSLEITLTVPFSFFGLPGDTIKRLKIKLKKTIHISTSFNRKIVNNQKLYLYKLSSNPYCLSFIPFSKY